MKLRGIASDFLLPADERLLFDCLEQGVVCFDFQKQIQFLNSTFRRNTSWNPEQLIGKAIREIIVPEDFELFESGVSGLSKEEPQWKAELQFFDSGKQVRLMSVEIVFRSNLGLYVLLLRDLVPLELLEEQARNKMFQMLENIPDGFFTVDRDWRLLYLNKEAEKIALKNKRELVGKKLWEAYPEMVGTYVHSKYIEAMETGRQIRFEGYLPQFDSWYETNLFPSSEGLAIYFRNVTETKRQREELKAYADQLKQSNEELEQFAHIISHDLKEPLRMVSSFVHLLKQEYAGELDKDADEFINYISEGSSRMQEMISDLLLYSRATRAQADQVPVSLQQVVNEVARELDSEMKKVNARLVVGELPEADASFEQMKLLFRNLIQNALKFRAADAAPLIEIGSYFDNGMNVVCVSDNGMGLDVQYSKKIFQIFQKLHTREKYSGSGIGLAIAKKIVERNGGQIWVESQKGRGAQFYFSIPPTLKSQKQAETLVRKTT